MSAPYPSYPQQPGYAPQPPYPTAPAQPGYPPPGQGGYPAQQPGYPGQQPGYPGQQPGYPTASYPAPTSGFQPAPQSGFTASSNPGFGTGYPNPSYPPPGQNPPPYTAFPATSPYEPNYAAEASSTSDDKYIGEPSMFSSSFTDKAIRRAFIRKVYLILLAQLLVTVGFIALFIFEERTKRFVQRNAWMYGVSYVTFLVTYIVLACCPSVRRKHPTNIIMLSIFTLAMSYMVGMISSFHDTKIVFYAFVICAVVCLGVTLFAIQTKFDFTLCSSFLFVAVLVLFVFGIIAIFTRSSIVNLIYSALMALVFTLFLAYDTQMIIGGRRHEMSPEEYIFGALQLYLDVVYIFIAILGIFGNSN